VANLLSGAPVELEVTFEVSKKRFSLQCETNQQLNRKTD